MRPRLSVEIAAVILVRKFGIPIANTAVSSTNATASSKAAISAPHHICMNRKFKRNFAGFRTVFSRRKMRSSRIPIFPLTPLTKKETKGGARGDFGALKKDKKDYIQHERDYFHSLQKINRFPLQNMLRRQPNSDRKRRIAKMKKILLTLKKTDSVLETFDESVWNAVLENLTVFRDGSLVFLFRDGTEIKV